MSLEENKTPGFNCPNCSTFIEVTLKSLLFGQSQKCPGCLTEFSMDRNESQEAKSAIQKLNSIVDNLDSVKKFDSK